MDVVDIKVEEEVVQTLDNNIESKNTTAYTSTDLLSSEEILALGISETNVDCYRQQKYREAFTLEKWLIIPQLKPFTFETVFIILSAKEAKCMLKYCRYTQWRILNESQIRRGKQPTSDLNSAVQEYASNKIEIEQVLNHLKQRIDTAVENAGWPKENGFFAKFNTRSPKDVFNYDGDTDHLKNQYFQELDILFQNKQTLQCKEELQMIAENGMSANDALHAWYITTAKLLCMQSGNDLLDIFSRSYRTLEDLNASLRLGDEYLDISIALRKWDKRVPETPFGEFRCFVHHKKLNAITQYLSMIKFEELQGDKKCGEIKEKICSFFESIVEFIPQDSFVIDFLLLMNEESDNQSNIGEDMKTDIFIIELNPFHCKAGAGLFSWKIDRELFLNGTGNVDDHGCELRVLTEYDPKGLQYLHHSWERSFHEYNELKFGVQNKNKKQSHEPINDEKHCTIL